MCAVAACIGLSSCQTEEERAHARLRKMGVQIDGMAVLYAVSSGNHELANLLLTVGAPLNSVDPDGLSPLTLAVSRKDDHLVEKFLELGGQDLLDKPDEAGFPPLSYAVSERDHKLVNRLLEAGADPKIDAHPGNRQLPLPFGLGMPRWYLPF